MSNGDGNSGGVIISWGPIPASNICFPIDTPIQTDQGIIPIQFICPINNTIAGQPIQHITMTTTMDPYLISFEPHALAHNCPTKPTVMTKDHKVLFQGQLVPAYRLLDYSDKVKKVPYDGDILYNVLLEEYSTLVVNNMVCETLHPENLIAKLYNNNMGIEYKNDMINIMNNSLKSKDVDTYKSIVNLMS